MTQTINVPATALTANVEAASPARTLTETVKTLVAQLTDPNNLWIKSVTSVTNANNPTITTANAHNLLAGAHVTIKGVVGAVGVNGDWTVASAPTATTFKITTAAPGAYVSGGNVIDNDKHVTAFGMQTNDVSAGGGAITGVTNTVNPTVTTAGPHGLGVGSDVKIEGVVGATGANARFSVASIVDDFNFTVTAAAPGVYASGGLIWLWADTGGGIPFGFLRKDGSMPAVSMSTGNVASAVGDSVRLGIKTDSGITLGATVTVN